MSFCLAGAGLAVQIAASTFTLAWSHTVERTAWEEDWRVEDGRLHLAQARIQGSGAGMEPPPDARLENAFYVWEPQVPPMPEIVLRHAAQSGDWRLCAGSRCAKVAEWLGGDADPVRIAPSPETGSCPKMP